jgi:hypothetical protein
VDTHLSISSTAHNLLAELVSEVAQGLVERPAGVLVVLLGPKKCQKSVPPVESLRAGNGEVSQESDTLRLGQDGLDVLAVRASQY